MSCRKTIRRAVSLNLLSLVTSRISRWELKTLLAGQYSLDKHDQGGPVHQILSKATSVVALTLHEHKHALLHNIQTASLIRTWTRPSGGSRRFPGLCWDQPQTVWQPWRLLGFEYRAFPTNLGRLCAIFVKVFRQVRRWLSLHLQVSRLLLGFKLHWLGRLQRFPFSWSLQVRENFLRFL